MFLVNGESGRLFQRQAVGPESGIAQRENSEPIVYHKAWCLKSEHCSPDLVCAFGANKNNLLALE